MKLYILPDTLRRILAELHLYARDPLKVFIGSREYVGFSLRNELYCYLHRVAVIGDTVCFTFLQFVGTPRICIVDGKSLRVNVDYIVEIIKHYSCAFRCLNPPGTISTQCFGVVKEAISLGRECLIIVDGEEDLLALATALDPYRITYIVYGVPFKGVAIVDVEKFIVTAINLFSQFIPSE